MRCRHSHGAKLDEATDDEGGAVNGRLAKTGDGAKPHLDTDDWGGFTVTRIWMTVCCLFAGWMPVVGCWECRLMDMIGNVVEFDGGRGSKG